MTRDERTSAGAAAPARPGTEAFVGDVDRHMLHLLGGMHGPVVEAARGPIAAGGKRLRPLLVRAARPRAVDGDRLEREAFDSCSIRAAAAVELVHTASLVHDDLLDDAELRRGAATVGASAGRAVAVAAGDLLFALAFDTLVACREATEPVRVHRATRLLARAARTLAVGEAMQARQASDSHLPEAAYLERCAAKTGVLFAASLQLGAVLGNAAAEDVDLLGRFGTTVGTAFQVADDVLDCGPPEAESILGKRPGADLRDGTMTLPMLRAVALDPVLRLLLEGGVGDDGAVERALDRIRATGAVESARRTACELRDDALSLLPRLHPRFDLPVLRRVAAASVDRIS